MVTVADIHMKVPKNCKDPVWFYLSRVSNCIDMYDRETGCTSDWNVEMLRRMNKYLQNAMEAMNQALEEVA